MSQPISAEALASLFHATYERLAPSFGYKTREASAKPWSEVPEQNKRLMLAVCGELLSRIMPKTIAVDDYCDAFVVWSHAASHLLRQPERYILDKALHELRYAFSGKVAIDELCAFMDGYSKGYPLSEVQNLKLMISKSCLLDRLIYAGEGLRTRPCPIHKGVWSGCHPDPCPAGCNFGCQYTGWLPAGWLPDDK